VEGRVSAKVTAQRWYLRFPRGIPVAIFLLVSAITALSVTAIEQVESQRGDAQHRQMAASVTSAIERLANANSAYLRAGAALLSTRQQVVRSDIREFAAQMNEDETLRSGGAVGWAPSIVRADIPGFERNLRAERNFDYKVYPSGANPIALPMLYIEPELADNRAGYGVDVIAEPLRQRAVMQAIRFNRPTATGQITLIARGNLPSAPAFAIFMPVYHGPAGERRLKGILARGFDARTFITAAVNQRDLQGYGIALYDAESAPAAPLVSIGSAPVPARAIKRLITIADHRMTLAITPPTGATLSGLSLLTLLFGMMVAALLLVVARLITHQALEDLATLAWFEEQASIRNSLTRELNHRVKNTLANVLSIVTLTRRRSDNVDEFVTSLIGRVRALSATHDLLTQSEWGTTPIAAVITAELAPYVQDGDGAVSASGPVVELAPNDALSLGLAIHELVTNASKYGALSVPEGRVEIRWAKISEKLARVDLRESGGPPVPELRRRGFGTELIEKIVAHELKNPVDLRFAEDGVRCTLLVPVRPPAAFQIRATKMP
jgi:two-component sensor histidine kinase